MARQQGQDVGTGSPGLSLSGLGFALGAYGLWGFFPIFWKLLASVPALQLLAHRMVWSVFFVAVLLLVTRRWSWTKEVKKKPVLIAIYLGAAIFIAINWGLYIWSVNHGFVVETALGYFINPLINVLFGAFLLGEKARKAQWAAIGLAACGVVYLTLNYGQPPWIALTLAVTFALYGLLKKKATLPALEGLSLETALLSVPALGYLMYAEMEGVGAWSDADLWLKCMFAITGVATAVPLLLFAGAVKRLTLTTVGVIQYLAPTIQFLLGVFLYHEPFGVDKLIGFVLIWGGLLLYTMEGVRHAMKLRRKRRSEPAS